MCKIKFNKSKFLALLTVTTMFFTAFNILNVSASTTFTDIQGNSEQASIQKFADKGFITGYPDGTFKPNNPITRAEIATMFNKFNVNINGDAKKFSDVNSTDWFAPFIDKASKEKIVGGYPDGSFKPNNNISRYEIIHLVSLMVDRKIDFSKADLNYKDTTSVPLWVLNDVKKLKVAEILPDYQGNSINGNDKVARAEVVTLMAKALDKVSWNIDTMNVTIGDNIKSPIPVATAFSNDILGYLSISSIGMEKFSVRDGDRLPIIKIGLGHFIESSLWNGNIGFYGHDRGYKYDFSNLRNIKIGDIITYTTAFGTRNYKVNVNTQIKEDDWSGLGFSKTNKVTLITCIPSVKGVRQMVQADEIK